jgi:hypothetical protein
MFTLEGRAALTSAAWMQANPELADAWRAKVGVEDDLAAADPITPSTADFAAPMSSRPRRPSLARVQWRRACSPK